jgi:hypothetical protein
MLVGFGCAFPFRSWMMETDTSKSTSTSQPGHGTSKAKNGAPGVDTSLVPVALRNQEISERDVDTLVHIAEDPQAPKGRLNRVPKIIPLRKRGGGDNKSPG